MDRCLAQSSRNGKLVVRVVQAHLVMRKHNRWARVRIVGRANQHAEVHLRGLPRLGTQPVHVALALNVEKRDVAMGRAVHVHRPVDRLQLHVWEKDRQTRHKLAVSLKGREIGDGFGPRDRPEVARRKAAVGLGKAQRRQSDLLEVIGALSAPPGLARGLDRRKRQRHQDADHRHHHQQFHQRKARAA